jgi:cytochrome c5
MQRGLNFLKSWWMGLNLRVRCNFTDSVSFMTKLTYLLLILTLSVTTIYLLYRNNIIQTQNEKLADINRQLSDEAKSIKGQFGLSVAKSNCLTCHKFNYASDNLLEGVVQRVGANYLKLYITKQDSLLSTNDTYALALKKKFNNMVNSHNFKLSDDELSALIEFMK